MRATPALAAILLIVLALWVAIGAVAIERSDVHLLQEIWRAGALLGIDQRPDATQIDPTGGSDRAP